MNKTKMAILESRLFFSQSKLFENFSNCSDWLDKSRPSKKATFVLISQLRAFYISLLSGKDSSKKAPFIFEYVRGKLGIYI